MAAKKVQSSMGCGYVVFVILLLGGVGLLLAAADNLEKAGGRWRKETVVPGLFGVMLLGGSLAYLRVARRTVADSKAETARRAQFPNEPWKWKKAWQGPAIETQTGGAAAGLWIFAIIWNAISAPGVWVFFQETQRKPAMYVIFLFPLVGIGLLWAAIYQTIRWRRYGRARFVPSSLPGVIGGYLGGVIEVPVRVIPETDPKLSLQCLLRETRGSGKSRRTTENVLWEREEAISREQWVSGAGGTRIPVLFYIPPGQRDSNDEDRNNEVVWRLSAAAATAGVDFDICFDVPVFTTGETAAPPAPGTPVLEEYKAQAIDGTVLAASGIRREGDTFHFTARHLPGTRLTTAILTLGLFGLAGWLAAQGVPGPVWGITLFFALIVLLFALDVWCDRFELRIDAMEVVVTKPRPWGTRVTRIPRTEMSAVDVAKSMSSGQTQYFRLSLQGAAGVNPAAAPREGEPFRTRKLRFELRQADKGRSPRPREQILADFAKAPGFEVVFAKHIPGRGHAEAIGEMVLQAIRKS